VLVDEFVLLKIPGNGEVVGVFDQTLTPDALLLVE
jgi:hypothetical protein